MTPRKRSNMTWSNHLKASTSWASAALLQVELLRFGTVLCQKVYRGLTHLITGLIGVSDRLTELTNSNCWRHFIHVYWRSVERWSKPNDHLVILIHPFRKTFRDTFATTIFAFAKASGHYHLSRGKWFEYVWFWQEKQCMPIIDLSFLSLYHCKLSRTFPETSLLSPPFAAVFFSGFYFRQSNPCQPPY